MFGLGLNIATRLSNLLKLRRALFQRIEADQRELITNPDMGPRLQLILCFSLS
jgi:hypothetical protein